MIKNRPLFSWVLAALILYQSTGALYGGGLLMLDPSGKHLDIPLSLLEHSPFPDFLVPGLFLFLVLGVLPAITGIGLILRPSWRLFELFNFYRDRHWAWTYSYCIGILLVLWIDIQVLMIRSVDILHFVYSVLGVAIIVVAHLPSVSNFYRRR